jgi:hypothetical protein
MGGEKLHYRCGPYGITKIPDRLLRLRLNMTTPPVFSGPLPGVSGPDGAGIGNIKAIFPETYRY